jgi:hypothetical protein
MRSILSIAVCGSLLVSGPALAGSQLVNYSGGAVGSGAPSFSWQGFDFTLNSQPSGSTTAAHRVVQQSDGSIDIFLEESTSGQNKVTYKTDLPDVGGRPALNTVDFQYGDDLSSSTPSYSFAQPFYRTFDGNGISTAVAPQSGSDQGNANSPFTGVQGRAADYPGSGGFGQSDYVNNHQLGAEASFSMLTQPNGEVDASVSVPSGTAGLDFDLTPGGSVEPFQFNELLLQAGSFQDSTSFQNQFGDTGQKFSFLSVSSKAVPLPTSAWMGLSLLGLIGGAAAWRRFKASQVQA